jgi:4-hydroxy-2-oxoheptanedioate aldolase
LEPNRIKRVMADGGHALSAYVGTLTDPQVVELAGLAGFDGVFVDMEHSSLGLGTIQAMVLSAERVGIAPTVRPPGIEAAFILRLLDIGVTGLMLPHVRTADDASAAVQAVRYPPIGDRGMSGGSRAARFGTVPLLEHIETSNREILLGCIIEDVEGLENVEAIAAVEGIDMLSVGPSDLSRSLGVSGRPDHPDLVAAIDRVRAAARANELHVGLSIEHPAYPRTAAELRSMGVTYSHVAPLPEVHLLNGWRQSLAEARA